MNPQEKINFPLVKLTDSDTVISAMEGEDEERYSDPPSPTLSSPPPYRDFFDRERHLTYLQMMYQMLPYHYQKQEINRLTLAYFIISGLDTLNALNCVDKEAVSNWVLSLQAHPRSKAELHSGQFFGFHGSRSSQFPLHETGALYQNSSHLASTYCALSILKIIGYNLSDIDSQSLITSMRNLQQPDGSFVPIHSGAETDLRFLYCAAAVCYMLNNWTGMDKEKAKEYIVNCQSYDGGFGLSPGLESHGGATYCAVASLRLMGFLKDNLLCGSEPDSPVDVPSLLRWSLQRQGSDGGIQGRPNKPSDTCYAFWVGATLRTIGAYKFIDKEPLRKFLLTCQSEYGGFSKSAGDLPDLYHTYYGFAAFSILEEPGLNPLHVDLGITSPSLLLL